MKEIQLTQGQVALVDDEDFEKINQFKWCAFKGRNSFYAMRGISISGQSNTVYMHCAILNGKGVDHIDHNGLNNQKSNLRFCTRSENGMNRTKHASASSTYKGVCFHKGTKKWRTKIRISGREIYLGYFASEADAAKAYNEKAIELFGEFANLNNIN